MPTADVFSPSYGEMMETFWKKFNDAFEGTEKEVIFATKIISILNECGLQNICLDYDEMMNSSSDSSSSSSSSSPGSSTSDDYEYSSDSSDDDDDSDFVPSSSESSESSNDSSDSEDSEDSDDEEVVKGESDKGTNTNLIIPHLRDVRSADDDAFSYSEILWMLFKKTNHSIIRFIVG